MVFSPFNANVWIILNTGLLQSAVLKHPRRNPMFISSVVSQKPVPSVFASTKFPSREKVSCVRIIFIKSRAMEIRIALEITDIAINVYWFPDCRVNL